MTKILYIPTAEYVKFISNAPEGYTEIYEKSVYYDTESIEDILIECYSDRFCLWLEAGDKEAIYDKNCFEIIYD